MRYDVLLTRGATESVTLTVEADSKADAAEIAIDQSRTADGWEVNENYPEDAYLGSGVADDVTLRSETQ